MKYSVTTFVSSSALGKTYSLPGHLSKIKSLLHCSALLLLSCSVVVKLFSVLLNSYNNVIFYCITCKHDIYDILQEMLTEMVKQLPLCQSKWPWERHSTNLGQIGSCIEQLQQKFRHHDYLLQIEKLFYAQQHEDSQGISQGFR